MRANRALVSDACASALRAFYSAPQRGRQQSQMAPALDDLHQELLRFTDRVLEVVTYDRCRQLARNNGGDTEFTGKMGQSNWRFFST